MRSVFPLCLIVAACTGQAGEEPVRSAADLPQATTSAKLPTEARREASGYATIGLVPPSALPRTPPPMPTQLDSFARQTALGTPEERAQAWDNANGGEDFQREFQRLREAIESGEKGNFLEVRLVRDPGVMGEFAFYRDGEATLAKYTQDPRFRAVTTGVDPVALAELDRIWSERMMERDAAISLLARDPAGGRLELSVGIEEAEFRQLARENGWDLADPRLDFRFAQPRPEPFADPSLASLVRAFPRENVEAAIRLTALGYGRVVLKDGCFRMGDERGRPGETLVMFGRSSQLALDEEGYLVVKSPGEVAGYRIGEAGAFGGPNGVDEDSEDVRALRKACGSDPIMNVAEPTSERLFGLPDPLWVLDYAYSKDITYERAWVRVIDCMERQLERGRRSTEARDRCVDQYNGWDYRGEELPPPPGQ